MLRSLLRVCSPILAQAKGGEGGAWLTCHLFLLVMLTDSELGLQEPMVPAKLGTQAEKDRRLKKK